MGQVTGTAGGKTGEGTAGGTSEGRMAGGETDGDRAGDSGSRWKEDAGE